MDEYLLMYMQQTYADYHPSCPTATAISSYTPSATSSSASPVRHPRAHPPPPRAHTPSAS